MIKKLLTELESIGYEGPLLKADKLSHALELGPKSTEYTSLIAWLSQQIGEHVCTYAEVHPTNTPEGASCFLLELQGFLRQIGCVNQNLTIKNSNQILNTKESKILVLEILIAEFMSHKLLQIKDDNNTPLLYYKLESPPAYQITDILRTLELQVPEKLSIEVLFSKIENRLKEIISGIPKNLLGRPLFFTKLSDAEWKKLSNYNEELCKEYKIRRNMLLTRFDVTIKSFLWSEKGQKWSKEINSIYRSGMLQMDVESNIDVVDVLVARDDLAVMEKTSSASVRKHTQSQINSIIIGDVPDRGGRAYEQAPPPPEMPPWQKDRVAGPPSSGGYSRGGNTGGSGGRGWSGGPRGGNRGGRGGGSGGGARGGNRGGRGGAGVSYGNNGGYGAGRGSGEGGYANTGYANAGYASAGYASAGYASAGYASAGDAYGGSNNYSGVGGNYGQDYQHNSGRGGRVQGGWNQGGHNSTQNDYQHERRYYRVRGRGKRQH